MDSYTIMKQIRSDHRRDDGGNPKESVMNATVAVSYPNTASFQEEEADSDVALLRLWKSGEVCGYNDLVKRYQRPLLMFICRMIRDADDAKDVLQETFVRFYRSLDKLREDRSLKSWLYMTANNLSIDYLRKHKPGRVTAMDHEDSTFQTLAESSVLDRPQRPDDCLRETWIQEQVLEAIEQLPSQQRMAMTLRSIKGLSLKEIAEMMNSTEQTVGTTLFAARKKLVKILQPILREEYGTLEI